jgi:ABC-type proline/glycine betaine transport system permease subunit
MAYCVVVFGPLNGVRVALVAAAALAALAAFFAGFAGAGVVLLIGVAIHGVGWLYLYNQRESGR